MGNNDAMTAFEATVIAVYDVGMLTPELLDILASPYSGTDIDCGGLAHLETKDGKELFQVIAETYNPGVIPPPEEGYEEAGPDWYDAYRTIADKRFKFW